MANGRTHTLNAPHWGLPRPEGVLGELVQLHCGVGSRVFEDETVAVIESDKLTIDMRARRGGVVSAILASVGDDVVEGQPIYAITPEVTRPEESETQASGAAARSHDGSGSGSSEGSSSGSGSGSSDGSSDGSSSSSSSSSSDYSDRSVSAGARQWAAELEGRRAVQREADEAEWRETMRINTHRASSAIRTGTLPPLHLLQS